jgi:hypothetical protein
MLFRYSLTFPIGKRILGQHEKFLGENIKNTSQCINLRPAIYAQEVSGFSGQQGILVVGSGIMSSIIVTK